MTDRVASAADVIAHIPRGPIARFRRALMRSEALSGYTMLSPTLLLLILVMALPIVLLVMFSFWTQNYTDIDTTFTLANHLKFFERSAYPYLLGKSVLISSTVTLLTVLLAYPMAYFIAFRVTKHKLIWLILITVPFWTSYLLRVFAWKIILGYNGVINSGLMELGLIAEPLAFLLYNPFAVVLTLAHAWAAFAILPIYVSLEKIDRSLLEAATDLGDGRVKRFIRITLPLSMPGLIAASLLVFIPTVGDYVTPNLVGGTSGVMIGNVIQSLFGRGSNMPFGAALSIITMVAITVMICLFLWGTRSFRRRVA
jgi:spermidine/putrescine transport system permease protein